MCLFFTEFIITETHRDTGAPAEVALVGKDRISLFREPVKSLLDSLKGACCSTIPSTSPATTTTTTTFHPSTRLTAAASGITAQTTCPPCDQASLPPSPTSPSPCPTLPIPPLPQFESTIILATTTSSSTTSQTTTTTDNPDRSSNNSLIIIILSSLLAIMLLLLVVIVAVLVHVLHQLDELRKLYRNVGNSSGGSTHGSTNLFPRVLSPSMYNNILPQRNNNSSGSGGKCNNDFSVRAMFPPANAVDTTGDEVELSVTGTNTLIGRDLERRLEALRETHQTEHEQQQQQLRRPILGNSRLFESNCVMM